MQLFLKKIYHNKLGYVKNLLYLCKIFKKSWDVLESTLLKPLEFQPLPFWYITKIRNYNDTS